MLDSPILFRTPTSVTIAQPRLVDVTRENIHAILQREGVERINFLFDKHNKPDSAYCSGLPQFPGVYDMQFVYFSPSLAQPKAKLASPRNVAIVAIPDNDVLARYIRSTHQTYFANGIGRDAECPSRERGLARFLSVIVPEHACFLSYEGRVVAGTVGLEHSKTYDEQSVYLIGWFFIDQELPREVRRECADVLRSFMADRVSGPAAAAIHPFNKPSRFFAATLGLAPYGAHYITRD